MQFVAFTILLRSQTGWSQFPTMRPTDPPDHLKPTPSPKDPTCNYTAYTNWYHSPYDYSKPLRSFENFWGLGSQQWEETGPQLTQGVAMEKATDICRLMLTQVKLDLAGRTGPVYPEHVYDAMCDDACVEADALHAEAMRVSSCECMDLSTDVNSPSYHIEGDWCRENSARMMCNILDYCGVWGCPLEDFFCLRYEYNRLYIKLRAKNGDCSSARVLGFSLVLTLVAAICSAFLSESSR